VCPVAGAESESGAARHPPQTWIPAVDVAVEPFHHLMVLAPFLGFIDESIFGFWLLAAGGRGLILRI
jgi:hypothetical protein